MAIPIEWEPEKTPTARVLDGKADVGGKRVTFRVEAPPGASAVAWVVGVTTVEGEDSSAKGRCVIGLGTIQQAFARARARAVAAAEALAA